MALPAARSDHLVQPAGAALRVGRRLRRAPPRSRCPLRTRRAQGGGGGRGGGGYRAGLASGERRGERVDGLAGRVRRRGLAAGRPRRRQVSQRPAVEANVEVHHEGGKLGEARPHGVRSEAVEKLPYNGAHRVRAPLGVAKGVQEAGPRAAFGRGGVEEEGFDVLPQSLFLRDPGQGLQLGCAVAHACPARGRCVERGARRGGPWKREDAATAAAARHRAWRSARGGLRGRSPRAGHFTFFLLRCAGRCAASHGPVGKGAARPAARLLTSWRWNLRACSKVRSCLLTD